MATLRLTKTVAGSGLAVPADWTLTGTGPTTVSGAGDTGVVTVTNGTYELAESAGPAQYTASAWSCNGVMPTPTSVIVDDAGVSSTEVIQVAGDATYRAFLSGGQYEFKVGSYLYQVLFSSTNQLGIFKRLATSAGGAWTHLDTSHAPAGQSGNGKVLVSGTTIAVAYLLVGNITMHLVEFDTTTDLWGTPSAPRNMASTLATFCFVRHSDNTYVIVAGAPFIVYRVTYASGVWSGTVVLGSFASGAVVLGGVIDSSNRIWAAINSASTTVGIYQISATYALSSSFATATLLFPGPPFPYIYYPQICLWGADAIAVSYNSALTIGGAGFIRVVTLTPLAAPVVTSYDVVTVTAGTERDFLMQPVDDGGGNLSLFCVRTDTGVNEILQSTFNGATWNAPSVFYNAITTPPPNGDSGAQTISALQATKLAAGWAANVTMQTTPGATSTGEFIDTSTPTGTVVCTIVNTFNGTPIPGSCVIYTPTTPTPSFVSYDEPLELQGS